MGYDPSNPLEIGEDEDLKQKYFDLEVDFMVNRHYYKQDQFIAIRSIAILDIDQYTCDEEDAFVPFLALNFVDRFLSTNINIPVILPGQGFKRNVDLFVFCCVSLASKIRNSDVLLSNLLKKHKVGEVKDVEVMEQLIFEGLNGKVRPVTPITFMYFFEPKLKKQDLDQQQQQPYPKSYASRVIYDIQRDIRFTKFRPSTIAASAILASSYKMIYGYHAEFCNKISECSFVQLSEVEECFHHLKELAKPERMRGPYERPAMFESLPETYTVDCLKRLQEWRKKLDKRRDDEAKAHSRRLDQTLKEAC